MARNEENKLESNTCNKEYISVKNKIFSAVTLNTSMEKLVCDFCLTPHLSKHCKHFRKP